MYKNSNIFHGYKVYFKFVQFFVIKFAFIIWL